MKPQPLKFEPRFATISKQLIAAGREIPVPLIRALEDDFVPLALSTHDDLPLWASLREYDAAQIELLGKAIAALVRWTNYLEAIASDLAVRIDLDGTPTERVTREHALVAATMLQVREMRRARRPLDQGR